MLMRKWTSKYAVKEKNPMSSNQTPLPKSKTSVWTRRFRELVSVFGLRGVAEYLLWSKVSRRMFPASRARHPLALHPLWCRWGGSDYFVFNQIFRHPEYACVAGLPRVELVIDCGANAGYSAAYFLSRYPQCRLIAVEPEPGNFALLQRNLAPYGERAKPVHAGVWFAHGGFGAGAGEVWGRAGVVQAGAAVPRGGEGGLQGSGHRLIA